MAPPNLRLQPTRPARRYIYNLIDFRVAGRAAEAAVRYAASAK